MAVNDHGIEVLKKSGEEVILGSKANYYIKVSDLVTRGASTAANTRLTITNVSSQILAANTSRKFALIANYSGGTIFIKLGATAVANQGIRIANNESFVIDYNKLWLGAVNAIVAAGTGTLDVFEGS